MFRSLYQADKAIWLVAVMGSLLLSLWANIVDDVVNNDGIEYIKSAHAILAWDWLAALEVYKWPFYSALMALITAVTGFDLQTSASLINAVFFAWIVVAYLAIVRILGGNRLVLWFALLIILGFPPLNKIRPFIIRDPGFLALFLSGSYYFLRYYLSKERRFNITAVIFFLASAAFRIEGAIFLLASQGYLFGQIVMRRAGKNVAFLTFFAMFIVTLILVSWWNFKPNGELTYLSIFSQPVAFLEAVWEQVLNDMGLRLHAIRTKVLVGYSVSYTLTLFLLAALTIVSIELIDKLYVIHFFFLMVARRLKLLFPNSSLRRPWRFLITVAFIILFGFVLIQWFLSDRYPLAAALLLLASSPFLLGHLYEQKKDSSQHKARHWYWIVMGLILIAAIRGLDLETNKKYLRQAGVWMHVNLPEDAKVYTNNRILAHYFGRKNHTDPYWPGWKAYLDGALIARPHFDFMAFETYRDNPDYEEKLKIELKHAKLLKVFESKKGAKVLVFSVSQNYPAFGIDTNRNKAWQPSRTLADKISE